jgi:hypothetical protein
MRCRLVVLLLGFLAVASPSIAQNGRHVGSERSHNGSSHQPKVSKPKVTTPATPAASKHHGTIKRSTAAKGAFRKQTGHPQGWPGHVVDHLKPLAGGGADAPGDMQWQTTAEAKDKDERVRCS